MTEDEKAWIVSFIVFIIFVIIIIRPLRWLFTGNYYPKQVKNTFIYKWNKRSGFNMN